MYSHKKTYSYLLLGLITSCQPNFTVADSFLTHRHSHSAVYGSMIVKPAAPEVQGLNGHRQSIDAYRPEDKPYYSAYCEIDFTDEAALSFSESSLWADRIRVPWFQDCGNAYFHMRPSKYNHFHLGFEDSSVDWCYDNDQLYPSRHDDEGNCEFVDIRTEPRTYVTPHDGRDILRARSWDGNNFVPFSLERIRVVGDSTIRLCFKKNQDSNSGEWLTNGASGASPGTWFCWDELPAGYWDLSDWACDIVEAKILSADRSSLFSIDDLRIGN